MMRALGLIACLSFVSLAFSQQKITVPIQVDGIPFNVSFIPDLVKPVDIASELCTRNAVAFNIESIGLQSCVSPLEKHFQSVIDKYNAQLSLKVSLSVDGNVFNIVYRPDRITAKSMASKLCNDNAQLLGVTEETLAACIDPVMNYLVNAEAQFIAQRTISMTLPVNNKKYTIQFRTDLVSITEAASQFCHSEAESIGITTETLSNCIEQTSEYIRNSISQWLSDRAIRIPVKVNNVSFNVEIQPDVESAIDAATQICSLKKSINITAEQIPLCIENVVAYIRRSYTEAVIASRAKAPDVQPSTSIVNDANSLDGKVSEASQT